MTRLRAALTGFLAALALVAGLLWAGAAGAVPGVRLAADWPPLVSPGIVHRARDAEVDQFVQLLLPEHGAETVERFSVRNPGGGVQVWAEAYAKGRSLGRPFDFDTLEIDDPGQLAFALAGSSGELWISFSGGSTGFHTSFETPVDLRNSTGMSGTFHEAPTAVAAGESVPLLWLVRNEGNRVDGLPDAFDRDPVAAVRDPATFAAYDYALVIWCTFTD